MLFRYHLSFGAIKKHHFYLNLAIQQFTDSFLIINQSRSILGPSEPLINQEVYINYGVTIKSEYDWAFLKSKLKDFENNVDLKQNVDIDIMIKEYNNEVFFISPKVLKYTHCLKLLNELNPSILINNRNLSYLINHKSNKNEFKFVEVK